MYRTDGEGLRASILSECIFQGGASARFVIDVDKLYEFLIDASRGSFFVDIRKGSFGHKTISVPADVVAKGTGKEFRNYIGLLANQGRTGGAVFPAKILGAAADKSALRAPSSNAKE